MLLTCFRKQLQKVSFIHGSSTLNAKFAAAIVSLLLYTYQYFAENGFIMLKCINLESESKPALYLDAHVSCYESWQYAVIVFVCVYVIPFTIVISLGLTY